MINWIKDRLAERTSWDGGALIAMGVIADFRAPDILRLGFSPLYLSFSDLDRALEALESVMRDKSYLDQQYQQRNTVT